MSAIEPPAQRIWWSQPIDRVEVTWIAIALIWCLILFAMMPYWHVYGKQNLSNEAYRTTPEAFAAKTEAMIAQYTVRTHEQSGMPVVRPPAGSDVYLIGRFYQWYPLLEFELGKSYRVHISSMDYQHGFSLQPLNINMQIIPGYESVVTFTPDSHGEFTIVCNEYCGIGHHSMLGKIYVVK
jgi:cytochrome c oxidase subunit II